MTYLLPTICLIFYKVHTSPLIFSLTLGEETETYGGYVSSLGPQARKWQRSNLHLGVVGWEIGTGLTPEALLFSLHYVI